MIGAQQDEVVPVIATLEELQKRVLPLYILNDYISAGPDIYVDFREKIYTIIKGCYEHEELRNYSIKFKFYTKDEETYALPLKQFVILLFLLYPISIIKDTEDILDGSFIIDFQDGIRNIDDYINHKLIDTLRDNDIRNDDVNAAISAVNYDLKRISIDFSMIMGVNFNTEMFMHLYKTNDRIREIMETNYDNITDTNVIEERQNQLIDEMVDIIKKIPNQDMGGYTWYNNLGLVLNTGTGIKHKQLGEFMIAQGLKPDIDEKVIPFASSNSVLIGGSDTPSKKYIDASASRKSAIMNNKVMGKAGYYGKLVLALARTLRLSKHTFDCGTKHLVRYEVVNKKYLKKLNRKYYRLTQNPNEPLKVLNAEKDTHLIGKTIYVRSIATCALGDEVCQCCAGQISILNMDIADGFAGFESEEITRRLVMKNLFKTGISRYVA